MSKKQVLLCATMDTKAKQAFYLKDEIEKYGHRVMIIDVGLRRESPPGVTFTQKEVAGQYFLNMQNSATRSDASSYIKIGLVQIVRRLYREKRLDAFISVGGSGGATLACAGMHELPVGVPKIMITPIAAGNVLPYTFGEDILMLNTIVDVQNLNFLSTFFFRQAAAVLDAMLRTEAPERTKAKAVAMTSFGVTTPCVDRCVELLEAQGYEVIPFTSRGVCGGRIMEKLIRENYFCAVMDITTSELADEVGGGIYSSGPDRLRAAVEKGLPYVVVPGALEMINLGPEDTLQPWQKERTLYRHSPGSVKMRANAEEMKRLGEIFVERLSDPRGNVCVCIPTRGFSEVNREGKIFYDPQVDDIFIKAMKYKMPSNVKVKCYDNHINDREFADALVRQILSMLNRSQY
ncbi:MAG TPA: Tm-1-like ATP-binding domain-containing protein [Candidatus Fournierella excrementigallinarum]|nr:Tm-1-like ATP-binding domain-containing protein [Candidatus Fournierella excrementigallinarum]